ncbi:hypothetical protein [Paenibacillus sp. Y412MC10]|uniref:hypothetical protein n=1 Tax=Geobacillus sp. (strain Y412MC10) TaxID=481743 RepID=UPI0011A41A7F|nr:hypothetical protein [Paenibacillus sp. Y412MC10]
MIVDIGVRHELNCNQAMHASQSPLFLVALPFFLVAAGSENSLVSEKNVRKVFKPGSKLDVFKVYKLAAASRRARKKRPGCGGS